MSKPARILTIAAACVGGVMAVVIAAVIVILQTSWFANFAKNQIVSIVEDSTGGSAQLGSFEFDLQHLTIRLRNCVLHGTEPKGADPLLRVAVIELKLKFFSGIAHAIDLNYLGIQQPQVNLILLPDGTTNIPQPKTTASNGNPLETVVNLKVNKFEVQSGLIQAADRKTEFRAKGENLRALLNYDAANPGYTGTLAINPLLLDLGNRTPLGVNVNIPVAITKNSMRVEGATLTTQQSQIGLTASFQNVNAPVITAQMKADVSLPEIQRSIAMPIDANAAGAPKALTAELAFNISEKTKTIQVQRASVVLGKTTLQASSRAEPSSNESIDFNANLALGELAKLMKLDAVQIGGALRANGSATLDAKNDYSVNGTIDSQGLSIGSGTTKVSNVSLSSPFHVDPNLLSMQGLKLNVLGGSLAAKIFIEKMQQLSIEGELRNFSLPSLASAFMGRRLGYDGTIEGSLNAQGNLKAKGTAGYTAAARLRIVPGARGVPVSGRLDANYVGTTGAVELGQSYIALPHSRLDIVGTLGQHVDLNLVSRNLNDFLPAANFETNKPATSFPVMLHGGAATVTAQITGKLSAPQVRAQAAIKQFSIEQQPFDEFALSLMASPQEAVIQNGVLRGKDFESSFNASLRLTKWEPLPRSPVTADLTISKGSIVDLLSLAGQDPTTGSGQLTADAHIRGTYGNPLGTATAQVLNGSAYSQPFQRLYANVNLSDRLITLSNLQLDSAGGEVTANGTFQHPPDNLLTGYAQLHLAVNHVQLAQVKPLQKEGAVAGLVRVTADASANVVNNGAQSEIAVSNISADVAANSLAVQNQPAGDLTGTARTVNGAVTYNLTSNFAGSKVRVHGHTQLTKDYPTVADAAIQNLSIANALQLAGQTSIPASGTLSANAHVSGTLSAPSANLSFTLANAKLYQEPVERLEGSVQYSSTLVDIRSIKLNVPAGSVNLSGRFSHAVNDFNNGALTLKVNSSPLQVAKIEHVEAQKPGLAGTLQLAADLSATLRQRNGTRSVFFSNLNADGSLRDVRMNATHLGNATVTAHTTGSNLNFQVDSNLAQSRVHGSGQAQLTGDYPVRASLTFANLKYSNLAPLFSIETSELVPLDALVEGEASVDGSVLNFDTLSGQLRLNRLNVGTIPQSSPTGAPPVRRVELQNQGPIIVELNRSVVRVKQLRITGPGTTISASGGMSLKNADTPLALTLAGNVDLGVLQDIDREFYSSGALALDATLRGSLSQPLINGRIELKNANVNYINAPNGLSNGNGVVLLNGTGATIQSLTGQSGGGTISAAGFVGFTGQALTYNLKATANRVRVLYSGVSVVSNANLSLIGNTRRSRLGGTVTVTRIGYTSSSDAGSLLSIASTPPSAVSTPSPLLAGLHLDIHILTAPGIRVISTYTQTMDVVANLTLRGTAERPGMLGRINVTNGQLVFFGNTYTVNTGTINFYDPTAIEPILNVSLETIAQGVDVVIGLSGSIDDLKLTYRSDPPLTFEQIVQLLATNTTPANPVIAAQQPPVQQQSFSQMGGSALLAQAVANPLANRVQRVFGLTQFNIDPSFSGANGQPGAKVTLRQQVTSNITFTYITDVSETNAQIFRIQWDFTHKLSAVALRDFNGTVSVQILYKFTRR
ncbi:MAG: translocation/assembly module TamB domain-containing protein [Acidobacteriaceae bacterium]|nr:translocation/assembly module TamB domain-containing protein [Acidobacteriaceae bacterium]